MISAPDEAGAAVRREIRGRVGDTVTLLPFSEEVGGVTTEGLVYPLRNEPLEAGRTRGLSNVRATDRALVTVRTGRLLVIESPATLRA